MHGSDIVHSAIQSRPSWLNTNRNLASTKSTKRSRFADVLQSVANAFADIRVTCNSDSVGGMRQPAGTMRFQI